MSLNDDDDGPPTQPEVFRLRCPECSGDGQAVGYTCALCNGIGWVGRKTYDAWRRRQGAKGSGQ